jgi:hypothetical protein
MTNAPRELAELLTAWQVKDAAETVYTLRGAGSRSRMVTDEWRPTVLAVKLWSDVDGILAAMDAAGRKTAHYRRYQDAWFYGIVVPDQQWNVMGNARAELVTQAAIDSLFSLADVIEADLNRWQLDSAHKARSVSALDELRELLMAEDANIGPYEKRYLFELMGSVRSLLDEINTFGDAGDLRSRIYELVGVLTVLAEQMEEDGRSPFAKRLRKIKQQIVPWTVAGVSIALNVLGASADVKELGS